MNRLRALAGAGLGFTMTAAALAGYQHFSRHEQQPSRLTKHGSVKFVFEQLSTEAVYKRFQCKSLKEDHNIGAGAYSHVLAAVDDATQHKVALKVVSKVFTDAVDFGREVEALRACRMHPNIVALHEVVDVPDVAAWILVEELLDGGELYDRLVSKGAFSERAAARVVACVASALAHMHALGWVHNDVKPENLVFAQYDDLESVKLVDFGFATKLDGSLPAVRSDLGTEAYWPPEMLRGSDFVISSGLDLWGLGLLAFILLFGCHPFDREGNASPEQIRERAKDGASAEGYLRFTHAFDSTFGISADAQDLIRRLLDADPAKRPAATQVLEHPWVTRRTAQAENEAGAVVRVAALDRWARNRQLAIKSVLSSILADELPRTPDGKVDVEVDVARFLKQRMPAEVDARAALLERALNKGDVLYHAGDAADGVFVILNGRVQLHYDDAEASVPVQTLDKGTLFGEQALIDGRRARNARAVAQVDGTSVLFFPTRDVVAVLSGSPHLVATMMDNANRRLRRTAGVVLGDLAPAKVFHKGHVFFEQGDVADKLYVLKRGVVVSAIKDAVERQLAKGEAGNKNALARVLEGGGEAKTTLGEWKAGDVFGVSVLAGTNRMATATALTDCLAVEIDRQKLLEVVNASASLRENLATQFRRLKEKWNVIE